MSMELSVQGKNAIVTGAAGNIGEACVRALAAAGANVLVADMDAAAAERKAEKLQKEYPDVKLVPQVCDVTNKASVDAMVSAALEAFGRIDILNNIAGMSTKVDFLEMPEDIYDQMMDVNAKGTFLVDQAVLKAMIPNRSGKIVNMSSMSGKEGYPTNVAYSASIPTSGIGCWMMSPRPAAMRTLIGRNGSLRSP